MKQYKFKDMKKLIFFLSIILVSIGAYGQIQTIGIGSSPNDGTGDNLRTAFGKVNTNNAYLDDRVDTLYVDKFRRVNKSKGIYNSIQTAINAASENDVIMIQSGLYDEAPDISTSLTVIGNGQVKVKSFKVIGGDSVRIKNIKVLPTATYDTLCYINTSGSVYLDDINIENSLYTNPVLIIDNGIIYGNNFNIKSNIDSDKIIIKGGTSYLHGDYIYAIQPRISNDAIVYLDYERIAAAFQVKNTSYLQADIGMLRYFDLSDYSDSVAAVFFTVWDSAKMVFQCDNLNMPISTYSSEDVYISNIFGDQGRLHIGQDGSGDLYITNSTILYKSSSAVSHIIESSSICSGRFISSNNYYEWVSDTEGYSGGGCPIWRTNGDFYSYNDTWIDYGSDTGYDQIGSFGDSVRVYINGSRFVYKGNYAAQEGLVFVSGDDDQYIQLDNVLIDVPGDAISTGGDLDSNDTIKLNNVNVVNGNIFNSGSNYGAALVSQGTSIITNPLIHGDEIKYYPVGKAARTASKSSFLSFATDTVRMTKNGDALDSLVITMTCDGTNTDMISADFRIHVRSASNYQYCGVYDVLYRGHSVGTATHATLTVNRMFDRDNGTDWITPAETDIKMAGAASYTVHTFVIVNKSLVDDSLVTLQAFNCIGIYNITIEAK